MTTRTRPGTIWENPDYIETLSRTWENWPKDKERIAHTLAPYDVPGANVLDVGCGCGRMAEIFKHARYSGVDGSPEMVRRCRDRGLDVWNSSIFDLTISRQFDIILCHAVLCHIADVPGAIDELWDATAPGGVLLYSCYWKWGLFHFGVKPVWVDLPESGGGVFQPSNVIPRWMVARQAAKLQPDKRHRGIVWTHGETGPDDRLAYVMIEKEEG